MSTETQAINYKIGNERLISVTEKAARKLASLLEEKAKPDGALRLKVIGGGCSGLQFVIHIAKAILSEFAGRFEFLRLVECGAAVRAHTHPRFFGHFAKGTRKLFSTFF